jgi:hypothetical protein
VVPVCNGEKLSNYLLCRENAAVVLDEYLVSIGGREKIFEETEKALKTKKRGRQSAGAGSSAKRSRKTNGDHPLDKSPPAAATEKSEQWYPPPGLWEDLIDKIDACQDEESGGLVIYLNWKNGHKTKHDTEVIYRRCPQKVRPMRASVPTTEVGSGRVICLTILLDASILRAACSGGST